MQNNQPKIEVKQQAVSQPVAHSDTDHKADLSQIKLKELDEGKGLLNSNEISLEKQQNQERQIQKDKDSVVLESQFNDFQKFEDYDSHSQHEEAKDIKKDQQASPQAQKIIQESALSQVKQEENQVSHQKKEETSQKKEQSQFRAVELTQRKPQEVVNQNLDVKLQNVQSNNEKQKVISSPKIEANQIVSLDQNPAKVEAEVQALQKENIKSSGQIKVSQEVAVVSPNKKQPQSTQNALQNLSSKQPAISGLSILREAQKQRIGTIFQHFRNYNRQYQQIVGNYKLIVKNVASQLKSKALYKMNLEKTLTEYCQNYAKIHKEYAQRVLKLVKIAKEQDIGSANKYVNLRQDLKQGFQQLSEIRRNIAMNNQKLDGYINNYVIKSLSQMFEDYRNQIAAQERRQLSVREDFLKQQKVFKKFIQSLDKLCKKGMQGVKASQDIFVELSSYINKQQRYRDFLIRYGKTLIQLRKSFIALEIRLFQKLQTLLNEFKAEEKTVYTIVKQPNLIHDYANYVQRFSTYESLCTITDVDYIKSYLKLQNRKQRIKFQNQHFQQYLSLPFMQLYVSQSRKFLKGAIKKSFPMQKENNQLVHTISQNLIQYDRGINECLERMIIRNVNATIIGQGAIEFGQVMKGLIFTDHRTIRIQLSSADRAQELISYLNEMQSIGKN